MTGSLGNNSCPSVWGCETWNRGWWTAVQTPHGWLVLLQVQCIFHSLPVNRSPVHMQGRWSNVKLELLFLGGFILGFVFVCVRAVTFERFLQINNYDNNKLKNSCWNEREREYDSSVSTPRDSCNGDCCSMNQAERSPRSSHTLTVSQSLLT